ncbi:B3 domain-containing transcription factor LEC2-like [Cajanus cajan]|uniref:B3 domain-containing transcription factor LEC2-like n=1 Tax=Cajanus cajan TaxID=3821 RepID=UPI00098DD5D6|nr:B3 domain-containing transcription factor LEC2-like [Cajanus cajan]
MENFYDQFLTSNTSLSTTATNFASSSSNPSLTPPNMGHPQNVNLVGNNDQFAYLDPYSGPYDQNQQFQHVQSLAQVNHPPLYPFQMGQSDVATTMSNLVPRGRSQLSEEERVRSRLARERRRQARQRSRSVAPMAPVEGTIRERPHNVNQGRNANIFVTPDGMVLLEILTKVLKNSDVGPLGRIVLPKREAEMYLPELRDREGIDVVLKDVYAELRWTVKYKYWVNDQSRMYVLENTGDFVNHYELQRDDSITLYEDESKNLYVLIKKEDNQETSQHPTNMQRLLTLSAYNNGLIQASHMHQAQGEEENASNSLLHQSNAGAHFDGNIMQPQLPIIADDDVMQHEFNVGDNLVQGELLDNFIEEAPTQEMGEVIMAPMANQINGDQQTNLDDVYANLDNILEIERNYRGFHF